MKVKSLVAVSATCLAEGCGGDRRLSPETLYTSANLPAHVAPGGAIHIAGGGLTVIFR